MAKKQKFPKRLYVWRDEPENDEPYLLCSESTVSPAEIDTEVPVAVYELREMGTVSAYVTYEKETK